MSHKVVEMAVYGAEQICASCVNLPSSKDTYEWLEAAVKRKFPNQPFTYTYIDLFEPTDDEEKQRMIKKIIEEDLFYPVVVIEGNIVDEGNIRLKNVYAELKKYGYQEAD
ncbi:YuzD family protein [Bacillus tuaregi]|uniref:YuzD family protein n=1 Tax=Bacillus tuaregi TaxID=1816695 RepID=UPI0008F8362F|nr:YuzD family protein [Bacillus tuaregi]